MRRVVLLVPDLLSPEHTNSVLRQPLPSLAKFAEHGTISKILPMPPAETPEAMFLGMDPTEAQLRQGPLTIAALGADPPERSTHFHLSVLSFLSGDLTEPTLEAPPEAVRKIEEVAVRLNTRTLTFVPGHRNDGGLDHGLVWEGLGELQTHDPRGFVSEPMRPMLPEGDAETILRRYIDDSINLLSELEFNLRRVDEGLPALNVLWPWGQGIRRRVPNLALRLGEPVTVESTSIRMAGLARLVGFRHSDRSLLGKGVHTKLSALATRLESDGKSIAWIDAATELRAKQQFEELEWFVRELDYQLIKPLLASTILSSGQGKPSRLTLLSPTTTPPATGLALTLDSAKTQNPTPFDERALQERLLPSSNLWEQINLG